MNENLKKDIEYVKGILIPKIKSVTESTERLKQKLTAEVLMSAVHLRIFSAYLEQKEFVNVEDSWRFMNDDVKGVVEKIFYITHYLDRVKEAIEENEKKK